MTENTPNYETSKTVERAFEVIEAVKNLDDSTLTNISEHLDIAKSTAHRYLLTLKNGQFVIEENGKYTLGLRFFTYGEFARSNRLYYQQTKPIVEDLANRTNERSLFIVEEHGLAYYIYRGVSGQSVQIGFRSGTRQYLHATASGKAILANLPEQRVIEIIDRWGLPMETPHTISDEETLFEELEQIRETGIAYNHEELFEGLNAVAAPVIGPEGGVFGSLTISGPKRRLDGQRLNEEIPEVLLGAANQLELNLRSEL